ncbi:MAG: hypothetical protein FWE03_03405 [Firmicutes bacterium]|nr:hypothetical protein [Bacillota bacterium]
MPEFGIVGFVAATSIYNSSFFANYYLAIYIIEGGTASHKPSFRQIRQECSGHYYQVVITKYTSTGIMRPLAIRI